MNLAQRVEQLRQWQRLLDEAYRVPGTRIRFGWDAIIGLAPGGGDVVTALLGVAILFHARRMRIPGVVQARMFVNLAIDLALGVVPLVGDIVDIFWKANTRNMRLLERHTAREQPATTGDWLVVLGTAAGLAAVAVLPLVALYLLGAGLGAW